MEFLICLLIASLLTGTRPISDLAHLFKGEEPPHLKKARIRADREAQRLAAKRATAENRAVRPGEGKPGLRDLARVYWGDAMADAIDSHDRRRTEKAAQRQENAAAVAEGREPRKVRPSMKDRIKRVARRLWEPVGEPKPVTDAPAAQRHDATCSRCGRTPTPDNRLGFDGVCAECFNTTLAAGRRPGTNPPNGDHMPDAATKPILDVPDTYGGVGQPADPGAPRPQATTQPVEGTPPNRTGTPAPAPTAPTGEVANFETAMAELDRLEEAQRSHLEQAQAALKSAQETKQHIADTQATYRPAADAAGNIHQSLQALSLDQETVGNTGTIVDSMPPNEVDAMFDQLEAMEARAQQQVANAEIALAATAQARAVLVAKYGDAHATVQGELAGDSRFLAGTSV